MVKVEPVSIPKSVRDALNAATESGLISGTRMVMVVTECDGWDFRRMLHLLAAQVWAVYGFTVNPKSSNPKSYRAKFKTTEARHAAALIYIALRDVYDDRADKYQPEIEWFTHPEEQVYGD